MDKNIHLTLHAVVHTRDLMTLNYSGKFTLTREHICGSILQFYHWAKQKDISEAITYSYHKRSPIR